MYFCISRLQVLLGDNGKDIHGLRPPLNIFLRLTLFRLSVSYVPPQVPVPRHHPDPESPKVLLRPGYVPRGHKQDALGRIRLVASGRSPRLKVPEVFQYLLERTYRPLD